MPMKACFAKLCLLLILISLPGSAVAQTPNPAAILGQVLAAHGGGALGLVGNAILTGRLTIPRIGQTYPVTVKLHVRQKHVRTEYRDGQGDVVFIKNGNMVWEVRGTSVKELTNRHPFLQEVYLNPSLGLLQGLNPQTAGFAYRGLVTLRGRQVHLLSRSYYPFSPDRRHHPGQLEKAELYIDPTTHHILQIDHTLGSEYNRFSLRYDNYQTSDSIQAPMLISHFVNNSKQWELDLTNVRFNQPIDNSQFNRP